MPQPEPGERRHHHHEDGDVASGEHDRPPGVHVPGTQAEGEQETERDQIRPVRGRAGRPTNTTPRRRSAHLCRTPDRREGARGTRCSRASGGRVLTAWGMSVSSGLLTRASGLCGGFPGRQTSVPIDGVALSISLGLIHDVHKDAPLTMSAIGSRPTVNGWNADECAADRHRDLRCRADPRRHRTAGGLLHRFAVRRLGAHTAPRSSPLTEGR